MFSMHKQSSIKTLRKNISAQKNVPEKNRLKKREWLSIFLTALSIIGAILTLIGYGVAASIDTTFEISHETLFSSPFELLELSTWAILNLFNENSPKLIFAKLYAEYLPIGAAISLCFIAIWIIMIFSKEQKRMILPIKKWVPSWVIIPFTRISISESKKTLLYRGIAYATVILFTTPISIILGFFAIICCAALFMFVSIIGFGSGQQHINQYVIAPKLCAPLRNREIRLQEISNKIKITESFAKCISISTDRRNHWEGRVVFATSSAIILFDPQTGSVKRIPIKDTVIEVIDHL